MKLVIAALGSVLALGTLATAAQAKHLRTSGPHKKVHYGLRHHPHLGYWRRGPEQGYGFRFSSYKGDPFGSDDYYDGDRCHYLHHRDYCLKFDVPLGFPRKSTY